MSDRNHKRTVALHEEADRFRADAIAALERVADGRNTGFFTTAENNPWGNRSLSVDGPELLARAEEIVRESEALGTPELSKPAHAIIRAFAVANDVENHQRLGPIKLAQKTLAEINGAP